MVKGPPRKKTARNPNQAGTCHTNPNRVQVEKEGEPRGLYPYERTGSITPKWKGVEIHRKLGI